MVQEGPLSGILSTASVGAISALHPYYIFTLLLYFALSLLLPHLLGINHKYTQPYYFSLLLKPAAQKMDMKNSLMMSSRLALPRLLSCGLWSLPLFCFMRVMLVFKDIIYVINYTLFVIFVYL
jgi:hypothetical protein